MGDYLPLAKKAAAAAVQILRKDFLRDAKITQNQGKDIKTQADIAAQKKILELLSPSGIEVLAEEEREGDASLTNMSGPLWLVDPLDGTLNFSRGFAMSAVSIALWENNKPRLGIIHDIFHDRVYVGEVGKGAWYDDQKIKVSSVDTLSAAVLATGFPSGRSYDSDSLMAVVQAVQKYKKVRMLGSAALMLAHVAAGIFDVYEEEDIYLWDVAAGVALVEAAGGSVAMKPGSAPLKYHVRASNGKISFS